MKTNDFWVGNLAGFGHVIFDPRVQDDDYNVILFDPELKIFTRWEKKSAREIAVTVSDSSLVTRLIHEYELHLSGEKQSSPLENYREKTVFHASSEDRVKSTNQIIDLDGSKYSWDVDGWYEYPGFIKAPEAIMDKLNDIFEEVLLREDLLIDSVGELLHRARLAREARQYTRSIKLARRCLELSPKNEMALAVLCAGLRIIGRPRDALDQTKITGRRTSAPLLTSRAAAYCDLGMWESAKKEISRSLAIEKSDQAFAVLQRIRSNRPDL